MGRGARRHRALCVNCAQGLEPLFKRIAEIGKQTWLLEEPLDTDHPWWECRFPLWGAGAAASRRHFERQRKRAAAETAAAFVGVLAAVCLPCDVRSVDWRKISRCAVRDCEAPAGHHMTHDHAAAMMSIEGCRGPLQCIGKSRS